MRLFGLLDCNNFFVSCERLFRPDLINYPTVVLGSNDGVVVARSEESKKLGVPMGVPHFKVKDILKEHKIAIFSSNFELYRDIFTRVMTILRDDLEDVHQYSVDEAFFSFSVEDIGDAKTILKKIKDKVEKEIGVPVSLGAGKTMTIAKYASEKEKRKSGVCVLVGDSWKALTPEISLGDIWGIGGKTAGKMRDLKLLTVGEFLSAPESFIKKEFGVHGLRLLSELSEHTAQGIERENEMQKSIMSTRSFSKTTNSLSELEAAVAYHLERAAKELREIGGKASSLSVQLLANRHSDWFLQSGRKEALLPAPLSDTRLLLKYAIDLTRSIYKVGVPYKKAGVVLSKIIDANSSPMSLWLNKEEVDDENLINTVDFVNERWGSDTITFGRIKSGGKLDKDSHRSPSYTTNWNEIYSLRSR